MSAWYLHHTPCFYSIISRLVGWMLNLQGWGSAVGPTFQNCSNCNRESYSAMELLVPDQKKLWWSATKKIAKIRHMRLELCDRPDCQTFGLLQLNVVYLPLQCLPHLTSHITVCYPAAWWVLAEPCTFPKRSKPNHTGCIHLQLKVVCQSPVWIYEDCFTIAGGRELEPHSICPTSLHSQNTFLRSIQWCSRRDGVPWVLEHPLCPDYKALAKFNSLTTSTFATWVIWSDNCCAIVPIVVQCLM